MEHEESYYGHQIRIVTTRNASGTWSATAEWSDDSPTKLNSGEHASEEDAQRAVLSAAMAELDRRRSHFGKP